MTIDANLIAGFEWGLIVGGVAFGVLGFCFGVLGATLSRKQKKG